MASLSELFDKEKGIPGIKNDDNLYNYLATLAE